MNKKAYEEKMMANGFIPVRDEKGNIKQWRTPNWFETYLLYPHHFPELEDYRLVGPKNINEPENYRQSPNLISPDKL